jgi:hypothetical protein
MARARTRDKQPSLFCPSEGADLPIQDLSPPADMAVERMSFVGTPR